MTDIRIFPDGHRRRVRPCVNGPVTPLVTCARSWLSSVSAADSSGAYTYRDLLAGSERGGGSASLGSHDLEAARVAVMDELVRRADCRCGLQAAHGRRLLPQAVAVPGSLLVALQVDNDTVPFEGHGESGRRTHA